MDSKKALVVFEGAKIRRTWHDNQWYFSVVDVVGVLTDSSIPRRYWSDLKTRLDEEGFELYDKIVQLKLLSTDSKKYETDCGKTGADDYCGHRFSNPTPFLLPPTL